MQAGMYIANDHKTWLKEQVTLLSLFACHVMIPLAYTIFNNQTYPLCRTRIEAVIGKQNCKFNQYVWSYVLGSFRRRQL